MIISDNPDNLPPHHTMEMIEKSLPGDWVIIEIPDSEYINVFNWCHKNISYGEYFVIGPPDSTKKRKFKIRFAKDAMLCLLSI